MSGHGASGVQLAWELRQPAIAYDGGRWTEWGNALPPSDDYILSLWASENTVAIGMSSGRVYKYVNADSTQSVLLSGLPAARNPALWGFASDDLWNRTQGTRATIPARSRVTDCYGASTHTGLRLSFVVALPSCPDWL